jgi:hypothetical protein
MVGCIVSDMPDSTEWIDLDPHAGRLRVSDDYVVLEDHWMPRMLELSANGAVNGGADPELYARVEVNDDGMPRLTELRLVATDPESRGVAQADLREIVVSSLVEDLVAGFTFRLDGGQGRVIVPAAGTPAFDAALRFVGRARSSRTSRNITPELLQRVAAVYRNNIDRYPTKAVETHFQVSQRMAAEYVSRARKRGLLPPTKKGQKRA